MIPLHERKLLVALASLVLTGEAFLGFLAPHCRCAQDTSKMREGSGHLRSEGTVALCYDGCGAETVQSSFVAETKGSRSTETSGFSAGSM